MWIKKKIDYELVPNAGRALPAARHLCSGDGCCGGGLPVQLQRSTVRNTLSHLPSFAISDTFCPNPASTRTALFVHPNSGGATPRCFDGWHAWLPYAPVLRLRRPPPGTSAPPRTAIRRRLQLLLATQRPQNRCKDDTCHSTQSQA